MSNKTLNESTNVTKISNGTIIVTKNNKWCRDIAIIVRLILNINLLYKIREK